MYTDLTLGNSGTQYIAPANGYYFFQKRGNQYEYISLTNLDNGMRSQSVSGSPNQINLTAILPVKKGSRVEVGYNAASTLVYFRFIYAVGSEP